MAQRLGWQQTRVNKLEHGYQLPSDADLDAWCAAVDAGPDIRAELGELLTGARMQPSSWAEVYSSGAIADRQVDIGTEEAAAAALCGYQPSMVPGLLQTAGYARELLTIPGGPVLTGATPQRIDALIGERIKRQGLLYEPGRTVRIVLGQAALSVHFGSIETLRGQLDRLMVLSELPALDLRVLPVAVACPVMPLTGFWLDDDALYIETLTAETRSTDADEIGLYRKMFELLCTASVAGPDAVALIAQVAAGLRESSAVS